MHQSLRPLVAVVGPTASGKTALGEELAVRFLGEVVSADAKQLYKGMDIGTAKDKVLRVPQHLIDVAHPGQRVTAAQYQEMAYIVIDHAHDRGVLPVLVGGSMLYASAVIEGYEFTGPGQRQAKPRYATLTLGIAWDRDELKAKADARLKERVNAGLLDEVRGLISNGVSPVWLKSCGLEYRYYTELALGEITPEQAFEKTCQAIHGYIKRQYTWWRHHGQIKWVSGVEEATTEVETFLSLHPVL